MILTFRVKNFRSVWDMQTIDFAAQKLTSGAGNEAVDSNNIFETGGVKLLKTIGVYGANGSGKSNIIRALEYFIDAVRTHSYMNCNLERLCDPFIYAENAVESESWFEMEFYMEGRKYRYGFAVRKNDHTPKEGKQIPGRGAIVTQEWLYGMREQRMGLLYKRRGLLIDADKSMNAGGMPYMGHDDALYLTYHKEFEREGVCGKIYNLFSRYMLSNYKLEYKNHFINTVRYMHMPQGKAKLLNFLKLLGVTYMDMRVNSKEEKALTDITHDDITIVKKYKKKNGDEGRMRLNLAKHESTGTQKLIDIAGVALGMLSGSQGCFFILDEMNSHLHPEALSRLTGCFNDPTMNQSNSQLLYTSHDITLMTPKLMRRDQLYIAEKRADHSTRLYSLYEVRGLRNKANFGKKYRELKVKSEK